MSDGTVDYKAQHITIYNMDVSSTAVRESKIRVLKNSMYFLQRQENRKKKEKKKLHTFGFSILLHLNLK